MQADEDDWFDVSQGYRLLASYGFFDEGGDAQSVFLFAPFAFESNVSLKAGVLNSEDFKEKSFGLALQTDSSKMFGAGFSYDYINAEDGYRIADIELNFVLSIGSWEAQIWGSQADIALSTDDALIDFPIDSIRELNVLNATQDSYGFALSYYHENWGVSVSVEDYELEVDTNTDTDVSDEIDTGTGSFEGFAIFDRLSLFERLNQAERETLQRTFLDIENRLAFNNLGTSRFSSTQHNQQINAFADFSVGADAYFWDKFGNTYSLGVLQTKLIDENTKRFYSYGAIDVPIGKHWSFAALASSERNESSVYTELSIGYSW